MVHCEMYTSISSRLRVLVLTIFAFKVVDKIAGLNLNHRKCCWVQYGSESCRSLLAANCEEFGEMKIVRYAKYVGTMIGPEGHSHRWTVLRKNSFNVPKKLMPPQKVWLRDCAILKSMSCRF